MGPRVIRAKWETQISEKEYRQMYVLAAGPVPSALRVHKESRDEAKREYSLVRSRLQLHSSKTRDFNSIWVNLDFDTIYFVNFPATNNFSSWMRRINKQNGGANKKIKHIAIHAFVLCRLTNIPNLPHKTDFIYQLVVEQPSLTDIAIMLNNSTFGDDARPQVFTISESKPLGPLKKGGGAWGNNKIRHMVGALFDTFFTQARALGRTELEMFKKFRENNPHWDSADFPNDDHYEEPKSCGWISAATSARTVDLGRC